MMPALAAIQDKLMEERRMKMHLTFNHGKIPAIFVLNKNTK